MNGHDEENDDWSLAASNKMEKMTDDNENEGQKSIKKFL
jgi:hypothetical protein